MTAAEPVTQIRPSTRIPTHNLEAEGAVISAVFLRPACYYDAEGVLGGARAFYSSANRWIWTAFETLEAEGTPIDAVTVAGWLRAREKLDVIGGTPYLARLQDETPAVANVVEHARIVAGCAHQRRLVAVLQAFAAEGQGDVGDQQDWAQRVEQGIYEAARWERGEDEDGSLAAIMPGVVDASERQSRGEQEAPGIATGFRALDERINGLKRAKTYLVAGRPGMGKSAFIGQLGTYIAGSRMLVVELSTEQKRDELARRKLAQGATVSYSGIEKGSLRDDEWRRVYAEGERLRTLPLTIDYMVAPTIGRIRATIRRSLAKLRRVHGDLPIGLISVDQIGHLDSQRQRGESREQEISRLSQALTWMAGEFDAPLVIAAQLSRAVESRPDKRPVLSDLRDSGSLEQDAYGVLFPFRAGYYDRDRNDTGEPEGCEIIVAKHKNGPGKSVALEFHGPSMAFSAAAGS